MRLISLFYASRKISKQEVKVRPNFLENLFIPLSPSQCCLVEFHADIGFMLKMCDITVMINSKTEKLLKSYALINLLTEHFFFIVKKSEEKPIINKVFK